MDGRDHPDGACGGYSAGIRKNQGDTWENPVAKGFFMVYNKEK